MIDEAAVNPVYAANDVEPPGAGIQPFPASAEGAGPCTPID
ncbi:MAG: hypothetical protein ACR2O6_05450 [Ilumatobacteraceae bacterium]